MMAKQLKHHDIILPSPASYQDEKQDPKNWTTAMLFALEDSFEVPDGAIFSDPLQEATVHLTLALDAYYKAATEFAR